MTTIPERRTLLSETAGRGVAVLHDTDPDGYGAAWAISKFLPEATFFPVPHSRPDWEYTIRLFPELKEFQHIIVTDLSFDRETTMTLMATFESFTVIDHHATAEKSIGDLPGVYIDTTRSAAMLAWRFFKPTGLAPRLTEYIQDYDIWQHKLEGTHEIASLVQGTMHNASIDKFDELDHMLSDDVGFARALDLGAAVLEYRRSMAALSATAARKVRFEGHSVPCVNVSLPQLVSDVGHMLNNGVAFSVSWFQQEDGLYKYSLRSRFGDQPQALDVSEIAAKYGGGGHARAAGFMSREKVL